MDIEKFNNGTWSAKEGPMAAHGVHVIVTFPNGYGASVIRHSFSYGGESGLFELGVLGKHGRLTYETPITDDVIGWLTESDIDGYLNQIAELPHVV